MKHETKKTSNHCNSQPLPVMLKRFNLEAFHLIAIMLYKSASLSQISCDRIWQRVRVTSEEHNANKQFYILWKSILTPPFTKMTSNLCLTTQCYAIPNRQHRVKGSSKYCPISSVCHTQSKIIEYQGNFSALRP